MVEGGVILGRRPSQGRLRVHYGIRQGRGVRFADPGDLHPLFGLIREEEVHQTGGLRPDSRIRGAGPGHGGQVMPNYRKLTC